jgi:hypothetical protein
MRKPKEQQSVKVSMGTTHADRKWWWTHDRGSYNTDLINRISEIKREQYDNIKSQRNSK